jgi:hypothetical protein
MVELVEAFQSVAVFADEPEEIPAGEPALKSAS